MGATGRTPVSSPLSSPTSSNAGSSRQQRRRSNVTSCTNHDDKADATQEQCNACGNVFLEDSQFCRICGASRDLVTSKKPPAADADSQDRVARMQAERDTGSNDNEQQRRGSNDNGQQRRGSNAKDTSKAGHRYNSLCKVFKQVQILVPSNML